MEEPRPKLIYFTLVVFQFLFFTNYVGATVENSKRDETGCPSIFQKRCSCGMQTYKYWWTQDEEVYIVNCTNSRFTSADPLQLLPEETQVLIFNGNSVPILDWNIFGQVFDREELEIVDLSNNKINEILGKAFHKVAYVRRLILNHNDIEISGRKHHKRVLTNFYSLEELHLTNAFSEVVDRKWLLADLKDIFITSNMTSIYKLHLEQNEIWDIAPDMFCSLPNLTQLYLADNQLTGLNFDLSCLPRLQHVDLQGNKIKRLPKDALDKIDSYFTNSKIERKLDLYGNPFNCDCHLRTFYDWLLDTKILFEKDKLRCDSGTPETNAGRQILNVQRFECPDLPTGDHVNAAISHSITHALLTILIILVLILVIVVAVINREKLKATVKPAMANLHRSMQYRTIDKEPEVTEVNV